MSIFRQILNNKEENIKNSITLPNQLTNKQTNMMNEMNQSLLQEQQHDNILTTTGLQQVHADQFQQTVTERYVHTQRQQDANASDRTIRERAEKKASSAVKLRKKLQELGNSGKAFDEVIKSNYTIFRLNNFNKKKAHGLSPEDATKLTTLKKQAPKIYERLLKLEHAISLLEGHQQEHELLYNFALSEKEQAQNEWDYVQQMADMITYKPTINARTENAQLTDRRAPASTEPKYKREKQTELDQAYKDDLKENLKPINVNLQADIQQIDQKMLPTEQEQMNYVLTKHVNKIMARDPQATPESIKAVVEEYLKRLADSASLRFRVHANVLSSILNSRYRSAYNGKSGKYASLMEKQFSANTKLKTYEAFAFGILGGATAKEFSGNGAFDACRQYGTVSIKLNKEKMRGRATFLCGNSMGSYSRAGHQMPFSFYDVKHARDVYGNPDISAVGDNLEEMYFRAKSLKENGWKDMKSPEQEALGVINDRGVQKYFEAQLHGQVGAAEIEEVTVVLSAAHEQKAGMKPEDFYDWNFSNLEDLEALKKNADVKAAYDAVNIVNKNPELYGRTAEDGDIKLTVWDCHGNTVSFEDIKFIMEK